MVWAHEGRNSETLAKFFAALGTDRAASLTHVSADGAEWIHTVVAAKRRPRCSAWTHSMSSSGR